jgi:lipoprotein-anchoring transpeptidase ErfK/SrfK
VGETIAVPNVEPFHLPDGQGRRAAQPVQTAADASAPPPGEGLTVTVIRGSSVLTVRGPSGAVLFHAPVTTGSEHDPLPIGDWKITGVYLNPVFHYNPELFWDADPGHAKAKVPAGPNNPVGPIWIDISKEHYGFHGTPEPSTVGHTQSHGCIRLTNWDVARLAALVREGTRVEFR